MPDTSVPLTDQAALAAIVAAHVPLTVLGEVVAELHLADFDSERRSAPSAPADAQNYLAAKMVAEATRKNAVPAFATALCRRLWQDNGVLSLLWRFRAPVDADTEKQAANARRALTMRMPDLVRRMIEWEKWICVVAAVQHDGTPRLGTGVLVAADLVLTAYHTLKNHIKDNQQIDPSSNMLYAIFDHIDGDNPISDLTALPGGTVCVPFSDRWLVSACEDFAEDGTIDAPNDDQLVRLKAQLDFVVVRLAQPIGQFSRSAAGGPRRSWLNLSAAAPSALLLDDRIIIPQHPAGAPQRIDFGRFMQMDPSATRLRYSTETGHGTSGAPCFNQKFELVGVHNAAFKPNGMQVANQAVQIGCILSILRAPPIGPLLTSAQLAKSPPIWSVSLDSTKPRVVLSRQVLLNWIELAAGKPASRAERVYAAACRDSGPAGTKGFGKSFTVEILQAARRDTADRMVVLGTRDELLPAAVPDVVRSIADQLGINSEALQGMPERPTEGPAGPKGSDKLLKWASEEIPLWFNEVLAKHRRVVADEAAEAREMAALLKRQDKAVPLDVQTKAAGPPILVTRSRWEIAWIAIDRLAETRMSDEVMNLLAGLLGGKAEEGATPSELRRLRWLFIGYVPDFVAGGAVTSEILDPMQVNDSAFVAALQAQADAIGQPFDELTRQYVSLMFNAFVGQPDLTPPLQDPNQRLARLQAMFPVFMNLGKGRPL